MYISLKDSCSSGFNKWWDAHRPELEKNGLGYSGHEVVAADPGLDNRSTMSRERPHYPTLHLLGMLY